MTLCTCRRDSVEEHGRLFPEVEGQSPVVGNSLGHGIYSICASVSIEYRYPLVRVHCTKMFVARDKLATV